MRKNKRKNKLLALFLTAFFVSASAGTMAACSKNDADSSVDQSEISSDQTTDNARIKNGSFEFDSDKETTPIVTSPKSWSRTSVLTSKAASGVVSTDPEKWDDLTKSKIGEDNLPKTEADAAAKWSEMNTYDRLKYLKAWKDDSANKNKNATDLEFYEDQYNVSADDIPDADVNPGTHYAEGEVGADKNKKVLMIHNSYSTAVGTATCFTSSSSVTIPAGTSAKFSVWVKTDKLTYGEENYVADGNRGAYIGVTQTIAGKSKERVEVKNINTALITPSNDNNGWVQYEFFIKGSNYASSTFTVVLGLGQGTSSSRLEFVNGYAFFDDLECSLIQNSDYDSLTSAADITNVTDTEYLFKTDDAYKDKFKYAIDLSFTLGDKTFADFGISAVEKAEGKNNSFDNAASLDKTGLFTTENVASNLASESEYFKAVWEKDFVSVPFSATDEILTLFSASKTAYTAKSSTITLDANSSVLYSVWLKTSKISSGNTGAGITLTETDAHGNEDEDNKTALLSSLDSTTGSKTDVDGSAGAKIEDIFYGWQQCTWLIQNNTNEAKHFTLTFSYGSTDEEAAKTAYGSGYAVFANLQSAELTASQAEFFATGSFAAKKTFEDESESNGAAAFDTRAYDDEIENGFATLANYYGIEGGSPWVNRENTEDAKVNTSGYAGLLNKSYSSAYETAFAAEPSLAALFTNAAKDATFGGAEEPLLIYNKEAGKSYGFIAKNSSSVAASSYQTVSVRVKVSDGAEASVYLIDTDSVDKTSISFNTPKVSYWYDKKGNVCSKDPTDSTFKAANDTAFYLNDRGLYEVNTSWKNYDESMKGKLYANLSNYEKDEDTGNLLVADGGVSYNYDSTVYNNQGVDGIAYYHKDGKYYAYADHTVEVIDLMTLVSENKLTPRTINGENGNRSNAVLEEIKIGSTNGEWKTITFYLHTGNVAKNYRLEVWSGVRNGETANAAGSYVMFAGDNRDALTDDTWSSSLKESVRRAKGTMSEDDFKKSENVRYYAFSFLDSAKFLRYDATIDKDGVGNSYTSYDSTSSEYAEGVAYLKESDGSNTRIFVDYSMTDVAVEADAEDNSNDSTVDDSANTDGMNIWLFASSIILAVVLLIAIVSIGVRRIVKKRARRVKAPKKK